MNRPENLSRKDNAWLFDQGKVNLWSREANY